MVSSHDESKKRALAEELKSQPDFTSLVKLIETLLGEDGCPWDRARRVEDCPEYLRGELEELNSAIRAMDNAGMIEELGDLLFMTVFTMKVAEKEGRLESRQVFERIVEKMVYRHPHVFGGELKASTAEEVLDNWKKLKAQEKRRCENADDKGASL